MSILKKLAFIGSVALLASACAPQGASDSTPVAATPAATPAAKPAKAPKMRMPPLRAITAKQLARKRHNAPSSCNIELIDNVRLTDTPYPVAKDAIAVSGWFVPEISRKTGTPASLWIVDETGAAGWEAPLRNWLPRPTVLTATKAVDVGNVGFLQPIDVSTLPPGRYQLTVEFDDTGLRSCDKQRMLVIQ
ncbi:MAG: hypothetical protein ACREO3_02515 [Arenimonas sp.]